MKKYKWIASSNDGSFEDESRMAFTSKEECYNDMRNAALEKMKWNTEFHDCEDNDTLGYKVHFSKNKIIHESYSGVYTYEIKVIEEIKKIELTTRQIAILKTALRVAIEESPFRLSRVSNLILKDLSAYERIEKSMKRENLDRQQILELLEMVN